MKTCLKSTLILIIITFVCGCSNDNSKILNGKWKEYWGVGEKSNVDYTDIFEIKTDSEGQLVISCYNCNEEPLGFQKIVFDGNELSFEIKWENNTVPYILKLQENKNILIGTAINYHGKTVNVKFQKVE